MPPGDPEIGYICNYLHENHLAGWSKHPAFALATGKREQVLTLLRLFLEVILR